MASIYTYTKNSYNIVQLLDEIYTAISKKLYASQDGDVLDGFVDSVGNQINFTFNNALSGGELTTLNTTVTNHITNSAYTNSTMVDVSSFNAKYKILSLSANTVSGGTIYSGATNLYSIFQAVGTVSQTTVQAGSNIVTGGTISSPVISISPSPSVANLIASGSTQLFTTTATSISGGTLSGSTIYSGNTELRDIFITKSQQVGVDDGTNIVTGGTFYFPIINLTPSPSIANLIASGSSQLATVTSTSLSGGTVSGGTIYSGNTDLRQIFVSDIDFQILTSGDTNTLTTTSTSFVDIPGMTLTTKNINIGSITAVTYQVMFNGEVAHGSNSSRVAIRLLRNGVVMSGSTRGVTMVGLGAGQSLNLGTIAFANNVSVGETFKAQWLVGTGTGTISGRTLSILGVLRNNVA